MSTLRFILIKSFLDYKNLVSLKSVCELMSKAVLE